MAGKNEKIWQVWLSYSWLNSGTKRWPILFFHRWSMVMAVSVKNNCRDRKSFGSQQTVVLQIWQKQTKKIWQVWLSCAWLNSGTKWWPILFFHRWSMVMAVSVKNDCGDRNFATMVMWRHTSIPIFPFIWSATDCTTPSESHGIHWLSLFFF